MVGVSPRSSWSPWNQTDSQCDTAADADIHGGYARVYRVHVLLAGKARSGGAERPSPVEMAGFVKAEALPEPVAEGGRAAAGAGALASLSSELVSLEEGRRVLLSGTSCSASVEQTPAAQTLLASIRSLYTEERHTVALQMTAPLLSQAGDVTACLRGCKGL